MLRDASLARRDAGVPRPSGPRAVLGPDGRAYDTQPEMREKGFPGTLVSAGLWDDETNTDLEDRDQRMEEFQKMRRSDPQIRALETVVKLPIMAAEWTLETDANTGTVKEAREFIEDNLKNPDAKRGMSVSFREFQSQSLRALFLGLETFEKCFIEDGGYIRWAKFAQRRPDTIEQFLFRGDGSIRGVQQKGYKTKPTGESEWTTANLPIEKLLLFVWHREDGNWEGHGYLRTMYPWWNMKRKLMMYSLIGAERGTVGTPIGYYTAGLNDTKDELLDFLKNIRTHEQSAGVFPRGQVELDVLNLAHPGAIRLVQDMVRSLNTEMARCILADFLMLGTDSNVGSWALSNDRSNLFMLFEDAVAAWWAEVMNTYAIPQLCRYNFGELEEYPRLRAGRIGKVDMSGLADILQKLGAGNWLPPTPKIEKHVADQLGLPYDEEDEADAEERRENSKQLREQLGAIGSPQEEQPPESAAPGANKPGRLAASVDDEHFHFEESDGSEQAESMVGAADSFEVKAGEVVQKIFDRLAGTVEEAIVANDVAALEAIKVPGRGAFENLVKTHLRATFVEGKRVVAEQLGVAPDTIPMPRAYHQWVAVKANALSEKFVGDVRFAAVNTALESVQAKVGPAEASQNVRARVQQVIQASLDDLTHRASQDVVEQLNALLI